MLKLSYSIFSTSYMQQLDTIEPVSEIGKPQETGEKTKEEILSELQNQLSSLKNRLSEVLDNKDGEDILNQEVAEDLTDLFRDILNDDLLYLLADVKKTYREPYPEMLAYSLDIRQNSLKKSRERSTNLEKVLTQWLDLRFLITKLFGEEQLLQLGDPEKTKTLLDEFAISTDQLGALPRAFDYFTQSTKQKDEDAYEFHSRNIMVMAKATSVLTQLQLTFESIMAAPLISEEERKALLFTLLVPAQLIRTKNPDKHWPEEFMQYYTENPWLKEKASELFPDRAREFVPPMEQRLSKRDQALFKMLENFKRLEDGTIDITTLLPFSQIDKPYGVTIKWQNQLRGEKRLTTKALVEAVLDGGNEPLQLDPNSTNYEPFTFTVAPILTQEEQTELDIEPQAHWEHRQKNPTYSIELRLYTLQAIKPEKEGFFLLTHGSLEGMDKLCAFLIDSIDYPISIEEGGAGTDRFQHLNKSRLLARQQGLLS